MKFVVPAGGIPRDAALVYHQRWCESRERPRGRCRRGEGLHFPSSRREL